MKKKLLLWGLLALAPLAGRADDVLMPQFGKQVVTVDKDAPVTYYDYKGTGDIASASTNNSLATTIFKPAQDGYVIQIVFDEVDVKNDGSSYPAKLYVYNGVFDTTKVEYPTTTSGVSTNSFSSITDNRLAELDGTYSNLTYTSTDATGALSCCFIFKYAKKSKGWKATVRAVEVKDMTIVSATTDYTAVKDDIWAGKQNIGLGAVNITADGFANPDALKSISFTLAQTSGTVFNPESLKLYAGNAERTSALTEIESTVNESNGTYTLTPATAPTLGTGENLFCIGGDVLATAAINAQATLTVTGMETVKSYTTLTTTTPAALTVQPVYLLINNQKLTVTVDRDITFYDDGGKEGKISNNFEGWIAFLPKNEGKKVQIALKNISIFYTTYAANLDNQDVLKIYNGDAESNEVLYTAQEEKPADMVVKSTAANGALTLYLKSKTPSSYYQGSGFEGVASEFEPVAMTVTGSSVTRASSASVAAATAGVPMLTIALTTENTEPAKVLKTMSFTANGTAAQISKATLYYTGANSTFATGTKVGEATVSDDEFTITSDEGITLREGANYLHLACDIAASALNDSKVDAKCTKATFADNTECTDFTTPEGALTVANVWHSVVGTKTISVYDTWTYTHTVGYSGNYAAEQGDQITTFVPTTAGNIIEMNFSDFAVSYSSSSYGVKADYKIYAGTSATGTPLWQADATNCTTGPGKIRSTSQDGAITVVFNAKTASGYTAKGWHATVSEYTPVAMTVKTSGLQTASTQAVVRNQKHAALIDAAITTEGTLSPLAVNGVKVAMGSACAAAIDSVLLLQDDKVIAKAKVTAGTTELTLEPNITLAEGDNAMTLAVNVKENAAFNTLVKFESVQITAGGNTLTTTLPDHGRTVRNIYLLQTGTNTVNVDENMLLFYDNGGPDGQITTGTSGTVTFVPTVANTAIQLKVNKWAITGADCFYIYYGTATKDQADVSLTYYTKDIDKMVIISSDESGALTVNFQSKTTYATDGWEIEVTCHELQPLVLDSIVVSDVSNDVVLRGSADVKVLRAAMYVSGDRTPLKIGNFTVENTFGADAVKIYKTGTLDSFGTLNPVTADDAISERGTHYYWIALDIPSETKENSTATATLKSVAVNGTATQPKNTVSASFKVIGGMHGTYRVGASAEADFKTIQAAVDALQNGMEDAVTFLIESGTYTEKVTIPEVSGTSADHTVTFRSLTGNREDVIIRHDNYTAQTSSAGDATQGVFTISGADYITLSNLTLTTDHDSYHTVVLVDNKSEHITIDSCYIYRAENTTGTQMKLVYVYAADATYNNNYFTLSHSLLKGGYTGVTVSGNYTTKQTGAHIIGNTFEGQGAQAINVSQGETEAVVDGNIVRKTVESDKSTWCIDLRLSKGAQISNNYVYINLASTACHGLYIRDINGTADSLELIYNNVVDMANAATGSNSYGIYINKNVQNVILANNTVRTSGDATYPLYIQKKGTNLQVINNLLYSSALPAAWIPSASYVSKFDHNLLYSEGEGKNFGKIGADEYADIAAWCTAISSTADISEAVAFESDEILRPKNKGNLVSATALDFITTDITGRTRATVPTIGAYEWIDQTPTGCSEAEASVSLYPNPATDRLHVATATNGTINVVGIDGRIWLTQPTNGTTTHIDVSALPQGIYLLQIDSENGRTTERFIKK